MTDVQKKAHELAVTLQIGKAGITESVILELKKQLRSNSMVKVKFLRNFIYDKDKRKVVDELAHRTGSQVLYLRGFTVVLHKPGSTKRKAANGPHKQDKQNI